MRRGRNDICYCGSGLKFKKCCIHKELPVQTLQGSSVSFGSGIEDVMGKIKRIAEQKNFNSTEDLQEFFVGKSVDDFDEELEDFEKDPTFQAQQLVYDAWEFINKKDRVNCAKKALKLWPNCADAYSILADDFAKTLDEKIEYYKMAVQVGKRAIGDEIFREDRGHFWGILETRPFMRAKLGLATALWQSGEHKLAISHLWEMLEFNPGDNQGIRYVLMGWLFVNRNLEGVERLLKLNEDEGSASFAYSRLLYALVTNAPLTDVSTLLKLALKQNPFIPDYVLGKSKIPNEQADGYSPGSAEEAIMYSADGSGLQVWKSYPKALLWLKQNMTLS